MRGLKDPIRTLPQALRDLIFAGKDGWCAYLIVREHKGEPYVEQNFIMSRAEAVRLIAYDHHGKDAVAVLFLAHDETPSDVSETIARAVIEKMAEDDMLFDEGDARPLPAFVEVVLPEAYEIVEEIGASGRADAAHVTTERRFARAL
ncbi:MAG: hypothetical protein FJ143_02085 [Deltaproteobacteria bacterium]|nr:hypothetical protein [Deltaproteobacteria bacterium]